MLDYYLQIFKRKSFHLFRDKEEMNSEDIEELKGFIATVKPLNPNIKVDICVVPEEDTTCKRGAQYCVMFYSEEKDEYLRNIGYMGEQIDLYLASRNIGGLWFGIGKEKVVKKNGLSYIIMIAIAKVPEEKFRKDMFKAKRKTLEEIWIGDELNVAPIVRFTPSACNTQPWITENTGDRLLVYRYKKPGKRGIMPADKVRYYNSIDMGIYLFMLEICLEHEKYSYKRLLHKDDVDDSVEKVLVAEYEYTSGS